MCSKNKKNRNLNLNHLNASSLHYSVRLLYSVPIKFTHLTMKQYVITKVHHLSHKYFSNCLSCNQPTFSNAANSLDALLTSILQAF